MRAWIYNRIKGIGAMPAAFGAGAAMRVISSGSADNPVKPFMVVQMGVEDPPVNSSAEERTQNIPFTVWVHDAPGSMLNIDDAAVALKNGLPTVDGAVVGGMSVYRVKWEATGEDAYDDHYHTNTRPVRFSMMTRRAG
jgi:hypothetical protein